MKYTENMGQKKAKVKIPEGRDPKAMARGISKILKRKAPEYIARIDTSGTVWILER